MLSLIKYSRQARSRGFTLIELLIVVAIIGVIAAILIPNLLDSLQKAKQKRTMADMRDLGSAWFSWVTDQVGAAAAGANQGAFNFEDLMTVMSADDLLSTLYVDENMFYTRSVPENDGWGWTYEYRYSGQPLSEKVMGIRSLGRDGGIGPGATPYDIGPFVTTDYDQDIVWADGLFIRYPLGSKASE